MFRFRPSGPMYLRGWAVWEFSRSGVLPSRLSEQVEPGAFLPLQAMYADLVWRHLGSLDAPVCGPHQSDGNPDLDVSALPIVGLLSLCLELTDYPFYGSLCLHTQYPINGGNEGREMATLLEAVLQVHIFICPLCLLKTHLWCIC